MAATGGHDLNSELVAESIRQFRGCSGCCNTTSLHDHRDVITVDELHLRNRIAQHNRDIDHLVKELHDSGHVNDLFQELED